MNNNVHVISGMLMNEITLMVEHLNNAPLPSVHQYDGQTSFCFVVESLENRYVVQGMFARSGPNNEYMLYLNSYFRSEDKQFGSITVLGVPVGRIYETYHVLPEPEDDEDLFESIYSTIINELPEHIQQILGEGV